MSRFVLLLVCTLVLFSVTAHAQSPVKHGGKIDSRYDGFKYETVMRLQKMKVNCDGMSIFSLWPAASQTRVSDQGVFMT